MPMYEFSCKNCKKTFTLTISLAEYEKAKFTCPKCKGKKVEQRIAPFFAVTSKKSLGSASVILVLVAPPFRAAPAGLTPGATAETTRIKCTTN